jgi:hypothetical protein
LAEERDMAKDDRIQRGILGDINPAPSAHDGDLARGETIDDVVENEEAMEGGSQHGQSRHSGSRDVTEGVTGGLGTETGGTRNYRQGTGATGGDIGNRPE